MWLVAALFVRTMVLGRGSAVAGFLVSLPFK
jgi:hydrogenase/urease accessory protein HupE